MSPRIVACAMVLLTLAMLAVIVGHFAKSLPNESQPERFVTTYGANGSGWNWAVYHDTVTGVDIACRGNACVVLPKEGK